MMNVVHEMDPMLYDCRMTIPVNLVLILADDVTGQFRLKFEMNFTCLNWN